MIYCHSRQTVVTILIFQGGAKMSVTSRMTSAVSRIADAAEESARSGEAVKMTWAPEELPEGFSC